MLETLVGEEVVPFDYLMLRVATPGRATEVHYDYPFFARLHDQVRTVWTPIGDVPVERGPLFVIEGSNRFADLIEPMIGFDVAAGFGPHRCVRHHGDRDRREAADAAAVIRLRRW